jgi:hypothetical protein
MTIRTVRLPESPVVLSAVANAALVTLRNRGKFNYNNIYMIMGHEATRNKVMLMSVNCKRRKYLTEDQTVFPIESIINQDSPTVPEPVAPVSVGPTDGITTLG